LKVVGKSASQILARTVTRRDFRPLSARTLEKEREKGIEKGPPLPCPLLHKCVEEREIAEICKKLRCAWLARAGRFPFVSGSF
jgi:hypothetical protein